MADQTIYASVNSGGIYRLINDHVGQPNWTQERNGVNCRTNAFAQVTIDCRDTTGDWSFIKSFLRFDLSSLDPSGVFSAAAIHIYASSSKFGSGDVVLTKGYQNNPVVVGDWANHLATTGEIARATILSWIQNSYHVFTLNADGEQWVTDNLGGTLLVCMRHSYDYEDDQASATGDGGNANYTIPIPAQPQFTPKLILTDYVEPKGRSKVIIIP